VKAVLCTNYVVLQTLIWYNYSCIPAVHINPTMAHIERRSLNTGMHNIAIALEQTL